MPREEVRKKEEATPRAVPPKETGAEAIAEVVNDHMVEGVVHGVGGGATHGQGDTAGGVGTTVGGMESIAEVVGGRGVVRGGISLGELLAMWRRTAL